MDIKNTFFFIRERGPFTIDYSIVRPLRSSYPTLGPTASLDEVDPYKKPADLLEVSPKGLVPGLKLHNFNPPRALNESTVILEYLEEYVILITRFPIDYDFRPA